MTSALPHVACMSPYALADMAAPEGIDLVSLSQNESLRGPSPRAIEAAAARCAEASAYPDPDWSTLRNSLAKLHGISADGILCGSGSLDLIACIARTFAGPGRAVLAPAHAYPFFRTVAQMSNARFDTAAETECVADVDALLDSVKPDTALVFVANPGNPTGTCITRDDLERLRAGLRDDILLVIDEAYGEFADHFADPCWNLVHGTNTVVLRTLSKAYGMAGFRVGWGLFPPHISNEVRKVMNPNNVSAPSQAAAQAAVLDQVYMKETCAITGALRDQTIEALRLAGFKVLPSVTNFALILFDSESAAQSADASLRAKGIFLRRQQGAGLPHALRMTIGPEKETQMAISRLKSWHKEHSA
ncbi:MAG: histidinol-phosphate transaminase [Tateyamaria sp.]|uniref:pyridoxal phosphate-dependent aminotransferase n=1 Tax=Tateyamaria sp. TaxID=1929288 RepID=UPI0032DE0EB0